MQHANGHPMPVGRGGAGAGPVPAGHGHRNGRPISGSGAPGHHGGTRNRSNTGGGSNPNQFEGARSPPGNKSEFSRSGRTNGAGASRRKYANRQAQDLQHVPCKFFRVGQCQAGNACPFSHEVDHGEQPCKYFAKGNCKFGPKCANLHVDQFGRVLNRREKNLSSYNLGGRNDAMAYPQPVVPMAMHPEEFNAAPFNNQIPPLSDLDGSVPIPQTQPYDIPGSEAQFGSPAEESRFPMSPPMLRNMNEVGLPSSFDSKGSSTFFKHGPIAASVPSKFFTNMQSPPSSVPRQSMLTSEAVRKMGDSNKPRPAPFGSSPGFMEDEPSAPRLLHSQSRHKSRGAGLMSTSMPVQEEWERDDEELFAEEEDYIPSELLNSQIRHKDDRDTSTTNGNSATISDSAPRDFARRESFRSTGNGFGSPEFGPTWGSPSMASPGNSRFMGLFAEQKRKEEASVNGSSPFGPVGSPRRSSMFGTSPNFSKSPPLPATVSGITMGLKDMQVGNGSDSKTLKPAPVAAPSRRLSSELRNSGSNRTVSSSSVSKRIDEEPQDFVFAMEADDLGVSMKDKVSSGPWGQPASPSFGPVGAGRKLSMTDGKKPDLA